MILWRNLPLPIVGPIGPIELPWKHKLKTAKAFFNLLIKESRTPHGRVFRTSGKAGQPESES